MGNSLQPAQAAINRSYTVSRRKSEDALAVPVFFTLPFDEIYENIGRTYCLLYKAKAKLRLGALRPATSPLQRSLPP